MSVDDDNGYVKKESILEQKEISFLSDVNWQASEHVYGIESNIHAIWNYFTFHCVSYWISVENMSGKFSRVVVKGNHSKEKGKKDVNAWEFYTQITMVILISYLI